MSVPARTSDRLSPEGASGALVCELATPADDEALRSLLRGAPMDGWVRLAFPREPSYFAARALEGERSATIVVRRSRDGAVVAMGSRSVKAVRLDGRPARIGYLGQLRFAPGWRSGRRTLARAYALARSLRAEDELPFDLTAVVADNGPARRLLERGIPGMPSYTPLGELVTLVLDTRGRRREPGPRRGAALRIEEATGDGDLEAMAGCLRRGADRGRLAPRWSASMLQMLARGDLGPWRPLVARAGGDVVGCAAVWDQRPLRQCVVHGYASGLAGARPALNLVRRLAGRPVLPRPGTALRMGFLAQLAARDAPTVSALVAEARVRAAASGIEHLALGLSPEAPTLDLLRRRFGGRTYRSVIYAVHDPDLDPDVLAFGAGDLHLEVATL